MVSNSAFPLFFHPRGNRCIFLSGTSVSNEEFRDWRTQNGRGGDFLVFSDVKRMVLNPPDTFYL